MIESWVGGPLDQHGSPLLQTFQIHGPATLGSCNDTLSPIYGRTRGNTYVLGDSGDFPTIDVEDDYRRQPLKGRLRN